MARPWRLLQTCCCSHSGTYPALCCQSGISGPDLRAARTRHEAAPQAEPRTVRTLQEAYWLAKPPRAPRVLLTAYTGQPQGKCHIAPVCISGCDKVGRTVTKR